MVSYIVTNSRHQETEPAAAIRGIIRQIPRGKVATYSQVAAAAGYPRHHRQVVQVLRACGDALPWQRVVGAGGRIRLKREAALEQRTRLELEGVRFRGRRVAMEEHGHVFVALRCRTGGQ